MPNEDHEVHSATSRRLLAAGLVTILLVGLVLTVLVTREDGRSTGSTVASASSAALPTTTSLDTRTEVSRRLTEILEIRDKAFRDRDSELLNDIYTVDCPCLEGDGNAIKDLLDNDYHIVGGATSIRLRRISKASEQLWLIIADFQSEPLRIEAADGRLIREEPAGSELFQFALSRPKGSGEWLLGRATAYQDGSG
jgi:hypothetical protein